MKADLFEIVGVAGSGKTTITQNLVENNQNYINEDIPSIREFVNLPFFVVYFIKSIPTIFRLQNKIGRKFSKQEIVWLVILNGWQRILTEKGKRIIFLDQGPIFLIASLIGLNPQKTEDQVNLEPWNNLLEKWARILKGVIFLDAEDWHLVQRINERQKEHIVKGNSIEQIERFLNHNRDIYNMLINQIQAFNPQIKIYQYDTSKYSQNSIMNELSLSLDSDKSS